ncbi:MAG: hypothetical protein IAG13_00500 [Deltaproteobacteria bacterium]|nr:hypothetical protein [Nannocystaceae bacterium]
MIQPSGGRQPRTACQHRLHARIRLREKFSMHRLAALLGFATLGFAATLTWTLRATSRHDARQRLPSRPQDSARAEGSIIGGKSSSRRGPGVGLGMPGGSLSGPTSGFELGDGTPVGSGEGSGVGSSGDEYGCIGAGVGSGSACVICIALRLSAEHPRDQETQRHCGPDRDGGVLHHEGAHLRADLVEAIYQGGACLGSVPALRIDHHGICLFVHGLARIQHSIRGAQRNPRAVRAGESSHAGNQGRDAVPPCAWRSAVYPIAQEMSFMTKEITFTLFAAMLMGAGCNKDKTTATANPGEAEAEAEGDNAVAGAASDDDSAAAHAADDDSAADASVQGEGAEAEATAESDAPK